MVMESRTDYIGTDRVDVYNTTVIPPRRRRISWGAIVAGAIIALITMFTLHMLGLAIGAATINPTENLDPIDPALGTGAVIWLAISTLLGLFAGGFVAGRMASIPNDEDGILHGLVTWAVVTGITLVLLTSSIGNFVSGVTGAFGTAVTSVGQPAGDFVPAVAQALGLQDETLVTIQNEAQDLNRVFRGEPVQDTNGTVTTTTDDRLTVEQLQLNREIRTFLTRDPDTITEQDRNELAESIANQTNLTFEEARERVDRWEVAYVDVRNEADRLAREAGQTLADTIAMLAGVLFAGMVVGAFAAGAGGYVGTEVLKNELGVDEDRPTGTTVTT